MFANKKGGKKRIWVAPCTCSAPTRTSRIGHVTWSTNHYHQLGSTSYKKQHAICLNPCHLPRACMLEQLGLVSYKRGARDQVGYYAHTKGRVRKSET